MEPRPEHGGIRLRTATALLLLLLGASILPAQGEGTVVCQHELAARLAAELFAEGGNAVDAAVCCAFVLAVTHPEAGNIGGGGFMVLRLADGVETSFDFRECAPRAATERMFLDAEGRYLEDRHHRSQLAVGVPGTVAGLWLAHGRCGRLPWRRLVAPALALARDGFPVDEGLLRSIEGAREKLAANAAAAALFLPEGRPPEAGTILRQPDLARTLERIMMAGAAGFYEGETADLLVAEMRRGGGLIDAEDLRGYRAIERPCLVGRYRGHRIVSMGPPSSGGATLIEMLAMLEKLPVERDPVLRVHLLAEVMRRAFADRARYLGAPESVDQAGLAAMLDPERAAVLAAAIDPLRAARSRVDDLGVVAPEGEHTTHLSVVDPDGGVVALTYTIEEAWGSGILVPGAGFLLNNEMGDFNPVPGTSTEAGLIGSAPNLVAPGRRMLSSMTPCLVFDRQDRPYLVLGSPGGRTIINTVLLVLSNVIDLQMGMTAAVASPRWHHGFLPDRIVMEEALAERLDRALLESFGHEIKLVPRIGAAECLRIQHRRDGFRTEAGVDPRAPRGGAATGSRKRRGP
ncbi:MAG: gamma-glutamyltransferase [Planctomycetes bacterium]|nr:gamma-glutamyltransferase [Planctomycetota bacterium]